MFELLNNISRKSRVEIKGQNSELRSRISQLVRWKATQRSISGRIRQNSFESPLFRITFMTEPNSYKPWKGEWSDGYICGYELYDYCRPSIKRSRRNGMQICSAWNFEQIKIAVGSYLVIWSSKKRGHVRTLFTVLNISIAIIWPRLNLGTWEPKIAFLPSSFV